KVSSSPTCGADRVSDLVTVRLADAAALSVTLARSLAGFASTSVCCVMVAVVTRAPGAVTVATSVSVAGVPVSLRVPTVQLGAVYVPCDGMAWTNVRPAGNASVTITPVAGFGPLLVAVTVNVTTVP